MNLRLDLALLATALLIACFPAQAALDVMDAVNAVRSRGCEANRGIKAPLVADRRLVAAARRLAQGVSLQAAMDMASYRAMRSASLHVKNAANRSTLLKMLTEGFCTQLTDREFREMGVYAQGSHLWIVLATPLESRDPGPMRTVAQEVLELTNQARASARRCGRQSFPSAPPLRLENALSAAALAHSRDMAQHEQLRHEGTDGSTAAQRVVAQGYAWRFVGENVAAGPVSAREVIEGWLTSPGHCSNIMSADFSAMGVGFTLGRKSPTRVYWTQVFARPR